MSNHYKSPSICPSYYFILCLFYEPLCNELMFGTTNPIYMLLPYLTLQIFLITIKGRNFGKWSYYDTSKIAQML